MRGIICIQFYWIIWSFYSFYFVTTRIFSDVKRILTISQRLFYFFNRTISSRFNVCPFSITQFHPVTSTRRNSSNSALKPRRGQSSLFFAIDATNFTPSESNWKKSSRKRKNEWKKKRVYIQVAVIIPFNRPAFLSFYSRPRSMTIGSSLPFPIRWFFVW